MIKFSQLQILRKVLIKELTLTFHGMKRISLTYIFLCDLCDGNKAMSGDHRDTIISEEVI